jgi:hypothetical protein
MRPLRKRALVLLVFFLLAGGYFWLLPFLFEGNATYIRMSYLIRHRAKNWINLEEKKIVAFGDSTFQSAFDPKDWPAPAINLAVDGANPVASYFILQNYLSYKKAPACLIYSTSYDASVQLEEFFSLYFGQRLFGFSELDSLAADAGFWKHSRLQFYLEGMRHMLGFDVLPLAHLRHLNFSQLEKNKILTADINEHSGFIRVTGDEEIPDEEFYSLYRRSTKTFEANELFDRYLMKTAKLAESQAIPMYFVSLPVAATDVGWQYLDFSQNRKKHLQKVFSGFSKVKIIEPLTTLPRQYFRDLTHLRWNGSQILMRELRLYLKDCQ